MNSTLKHIKKIPLWKTILGILIIFISLYIFLFETIYGIILIGFSVGLLKTSGSEINLDSKTYRKIYSFLGITSGKWQELPESEYVSVFATEENVKVSAIINSTSINNDIYAINLFDVSNVRLEIYSTYNKKEAFDIASDIAEIFMIDLLDATVTGDFKWVDHNIYKETGNIVHTD